MSFSHRIPFLSLLLMAVSSIMALAQNMDSSATEAPPGSTVITSDVMHSDQGSHVTVFTGKVVVTGSNFTLKCNEMTVNFTKDGKVDTITASGDVVIEQPGRITHSGQAQYFRDEDKFVLTDQPTILDNKNKISAPRITIFRTKQQMITDGGKTTTVLGSQAIGGDSSAPSTESK